MNIEKLTLTELKSLAYDTLVKIEIEQKNLKVISATIAKKEEEGASGTVTPPVATSKKS